MSREHSFNGLFHIVEIRDGGHFGHGLVSTRPAPFPDTESYEEGLDKAVGRAKQWADRTGNVTFVQELGVSPLRRRDILPQ